MVGLIHPASERITSIRPFVHGRNHPFRKPLSEVRMEMPNRMLTSKRSMLDFLMDVERIPRASVFRRFVVPLRVFSSPISAPQSHHPFFFLSPMLLSHGVVRENLTISMSHFSSEKIHPSFFFSMPSERFVRGHRLFLLLHVFVSNFMVSYECEMFHPLLRSRTERKKEMDESENGTTRRNGIDNPEDTISFDGSKT